VYGDLIRGGKLGELQEDETDGGGRKKTEFLAIQ
jgi:hypothetical protein